MNRRDLRSVGELLRSADLSTRQILMDFHGDDGPPMLRTWGEVVQGAAELWQALPAPGQDPAGRRDAKAMTRLDSVARNIHRAQLPTSRGSGWPGEGPSDERLLTVAESFSRAADLVTRYHRRTRPLAPAVRADLDAARMRIMHILYVGSHGVGLALREHVRDERMATLGARQPQVTRAIPRGREAITRLAVFEQLAGACVGGRFAAASQGEAVDPPQGLGRLAEALLIWDIQAHRTLATAPTPANLTMTARTQATVATAAAAMARAGVASGHVDPAACDRLSPALDATQAAWTHMAGRWDELIAPTTRRTERDLAGAAGELRAALLEIVHDKTTMASPDVMAARVDLAAAARTFQQALTAAVDVAYLVRDLGAQHQDLTGPARTLSHRVLAEAAARSGSGAHGSDLAAVVDPKDILTNRMIPLPVSVRDGLVQAASDTIDAAGNAMSAASSLGRAATPISASARLPGGSAGRHAEDRHVQTVLPVSVPGYQR